MSNSLFSQVVLQSATRLALPISMYPGLALTGAKVSDIVTSPRVNPPSRA